MNDANERAMQRLEEAARAARDEKRREVKKRKKVSRGAEKDFRFISEFEVEAALGMPGTSIGIRVDDPVDDDILRAMKEDAKRWSRELAPIGKLKLKSVDAGNAWTLQDGEPDLIGLAWVYLKYKPEAAIT